MNVVAMVVICGPTEMTIYGLTGEHNIVHGTNYLYLIFAHTATLSTQLATRTYADKLTKTHTHTQTHTHTHRHTHTQTNTNGHSNGQAFI